MVAAKNIPLNAPIKTDRALAFIPKTDLDSSFPIACAYCGRTRMPKRGTVQCTKCQVVQYCTVLCRHEDECIHRFECAGHRLGLWNRTTTHLLVRNFVIGICSDDAMVESYSKAEDYEAWFDQFKLADDNMSGYAEFLQQNLSNLNQSDFAVERYVMALVGFVDVDAEIYCI